jgi:hypothetical protein
MYYNMGFYWKRTLPLVSSRVGSDQGGIGGSGIRGSGVASSRAVRMARANRPEVDLTATARGRLWGYRKNRILVNTRGTRGVNAMDNLFLRKRYDATQ